MENNEEKFIPEVHFDEEGRLVVTINDTEVRRTKVNSGRPYRFTYDGEEYHFIYEKTPMGTERVFFYPLGDYTKRKVIIERGEDE